MQGQLITKKNYLYGRLSKEDEQQGDSNSIINQRNILTKYAEENGFKHHEFIYDDGYSGADFERPAFKKMIEEVESGNVATVIVKDMSRFGRDYLKVGFFTEMLFVEKDVRFIAINDNVDNAQGENDFVPMMNLFNEWFVRNTSKKIRAVKQAKGKAGEKLTGFPKYGYRKDPVSPKDWIIDPESAEVVKRVFQMFVSGINAAQIAQKLTQERILCPSAYKEINGINKAPQKCKEPCHWHTTTIHKMLDTREYIGDTVNFKTYTKSYKDKTPKANPIENQMIFENTHPAIIDLSTWELVRKLREHKHRPTRHGNVGLFTGLAYCADCQEKLYYHTRELFNKAKDKSRLDGAYSCSTYRKQTQYQRQNGTGCTAHHIREEVLEQLVLEELRELLKFVVKNETKFAKLVMAQSAKEQIKIMATKKQTAQKIHNRINELDTLIERSYEDNVIGKLTDERFTKLSAKYETEQAELTNKLTALADEIAELESKTANVGKFMEKVRKYTTEIDKLTPAITREFVDRIIVHEATSPRKNRVQKIEIVYNNIGVVPCLDMKVGA